MLIRVCFTFCLIFVLFIHAIAGTTNAAHKFYTSLTEVELNRETRSLEITMRVFADDLENALSKRAGTRVYLDKTPGVDRQILAYVNDSFELKNKNGQAKRLIWVGKEVKVDAVWLYIEAPMPEGLDGAQLRNRLLFEMFAEQVNIVDLKDRERRANLVFAASDGFKQIVLA